MKHPERLKEWLRLMKWSSWGPTMNSQMCTDHFEEKYVCRGGKGKRPRLTSLAVPTIFSFPNHLIRRLSKKSNRRRVTVFLEDKARRRQKYHKQAGNTTSRKSGHPTPQRKSDQIWHPSIWHPSRFHDNYCKPGSTQWAGRTVRNENEVPSETLQSQGLLFIPKHAIMIRGKWKWLTVDVKGPFPVTQYGHTFLLTVMDYYSKWLEAYPMKTSNSEEIAKNMSDLISRFGFPNGILSHLDPSLVSEINCDLGKRVTLTEDRLIFFHPQTVSLDPLTRSLIDRMLAELVADHPDSWDVYLAASIFRFCCKEHPTNGQRPISLLRSSGSQKVGTVSKKLPDVIKGTTFVLLDAQSPSRKVEVQCNQCSQWSNINQAAEMKKYEDKRLDEEDYTFTCLNCRVAMSCRVALEIMKG